MGRVKKMWRHEKKQVTWSPFSSGNTILKSGEIYLYTGFVVYNCSDANIPAGLLLFHFFISFIHQTKPQNLSEVINSSAFWAFRLTTMVFLRLNKL